jgi:hypothetical protein
MTSAKALVIFSLRPQSVRLQTECKRPSTCAERALERSRRAFELFLVEMGALG